MKEITDKIIYEYKRHLLDEEKSPATIEKYLRDVTTFRIWLRRREVDKQVMLEYKEYLISVYSPRSVNSILSSLNSLFDYLSLHDCKVKTLKITVIDAEYKDCEITLAKTKYFLNEPFGDNTVTKLVARYTNGSARRIDASDIASVKINKYFSDRIGKRSLPVSVTTTDGEVYTSDVTIEIVPVEFTHIEFVPPTNRTYYVDSRADSFNPDGMRFIRHYNDGSYEITEAADADYELNFPIISDWQIGGQTDVHVIYDGADYSFKIDVVESVPAEIRVKLYFTNYDPTMYTNQPFRAYDYEMQVISAAGVKSDYERLDRYDNYCYDIIDR